jgi:DNA helicase-2/ATP-dependent DNA helicase PcrA
MTRAEKKLVISYSEKNNKDKQLAKSRFVAELEQAGSVDTKACRLEQGELESALLTILDEPPKGTQSIYHSDYVGDLLKDYHLSATHLSSYLACPHSFFYTNILRVPKPRNAAMAFGTSVHEALEYLFASMQKSEKQLFPPKSAFIEIFVKEMNRRQDSFTEIEFTRRLAKGIKNMEALYDQHSVEWHKDVLIEKAFRVELADGVNLNGRVDKLEKLSGNSINLVDYKTGAFDKKKFQRPDPLRVLKAESEGKEVKHEDLHGGDYWRQAVFYKIMVEKSPENSYQVSSTEFFFVEPDPKSEIFVHHKVEITPEDEEIVREQIMTVHRKIMNREFEQGCTNRYCEWCSG